MEQTQHLEYTPVDAAYAWLSLLFAFCFCQALPISEHPLGGFLLIVALYAAGFVILRLKEVKLRPVCILSALSALVIGAAMLLTNAGFLLRLSLAYCLASYGFFLYAAMGNRIEEGFSDYIYLDFIKTLFVLPFCSFGSLFQAFSSKSARKSSMLLVKILAGLLMAIVPTVLVFLFLSYDSGFMKILDDIFTINFDDFGQTVGSLCFAVPLAMYGFGLYTSSGKKVLYETMTPERCHAGLQRTKVLPPLTAAITVLPILFLYAVFFVSQWKYYISGFTGVLPENFSYAEYARQGFFELCSVSVINLLMIVFIAFFIQRNKKERSTTLTIVCVVFCLCTLVLISTAIAKLAMYIQHYGLTQKRVYALWLMVLIGLVFPVITVSRFLRKSKTVALCLTVAIVMFAGLSVCNVNSLCAHYNAQRYISGTLATIDMDAMEELGDSAIPALVQVANSMDGEKDPQLRQQIDALLQEALRQKEQEEFSLFAFSVPAALADAALKDYIQPTQ